MVEELYGPNPCEDSVFVYECTLFRDALDFSALYAVLSIYAFS